MFTGIIEEVGLVSSNKSKPHGLHLSIKAKSVLHGLQVGDSVSVNGVCLTVTELGKDFFGVDVVRETFMISTFSKARAGFKANLETAMKSEGRFGGHLVSGHVDGIGKIERVGRIGGSFELIIRCSPSLMRYVIEKGSIAVDGISLTISEVMSSGFKVAVIPYTASVTTLGGKSAGDEVNIEVDMLAKYVERQVGHLKPKASRISESFLRRAGFMS
jgi:riboflavin synthase